jgi:hypothetical protein
MNNHGILAIVTLAASLLSARGAESILQTVTLTGDQKYVIVIQDEKVIGGYVQGSERWQVIGGAYDGQGLTILQKRDGATDPEKWLTTHFTVHGDRFVATAQMNSAGQTRELRREYRSTIQAPESSALFAARTKLQELLLRYREKHPVVTRQREIIAELEKQ